MEMKRTLVSLLAPVIMAASGPSCQPAYANDGIKGPRSVAPVQESARRLELNEQNNYSAAETFLLEVYQRQAAKEVKGDEKVVVSVDAKFDSETGLLRLAYGLEGLTADRGRKIYSVDSQEFSKSTRPKPFLNDSHSFIYVVSDSPEGVSVENIEQWGRFHGQKVERRRLIPAEQKLTDRVIMYALDEGFEKAVEAGAIGITGGGYKAIAVWDEAVDLFRFPDSMKVDAAGRLKRYSQGVSQRSAQRREQGVEDILQGVSMGKISLFRDPRLLNLSNSFIAREVRATLKNNSSEDQNVSVYFLNTRFQDMNEWYADLKDVAVEVKLSSRLKGFVGDWVAFGGMDDGKQIQEDKIEPLFFSIKPERIEFKSFKDSLLSESVTHLENSILGFCFPKIEKGGVIRKVSPTEIHIGVIDLFETPPKYPSGVELEKVFNKDVLFMRRVNRLSVGDISREDYLGRWNVKARLDVHSLRDFSSTSTSSKDLEDYLIKEEEIVVRRGSLSETHRISWANLPLKDYVAIELLDEDSFIFLKRTDSKRITMSSSEIDSSHLKNFRKFLDFGDVEFMKRYIEGIFNDPGIELER
jgi:hypothetical protein